MMKIRYFVLLLSLTTSGIVGTLSNNSDDGCSLPFCQCLKRVYLTAICSGRSLTYIPRFPKYILSVIITNTSLRHVDLFNLTFSRIIRINLTDNLLQYIDRNAFQNLTFIKSLEISREPHLNVNMLKQSLQSLSVSKLAFLTFTYNSWRVLPEDMFASFDASRIRHLSLSGNNFTFINFTTFKNMTSLKSMDLTKNNIERISLVKMEALVFLYLNGNQMPKLPNWCGRKMVINFPRLIKLSLSYNNIGYIGIHSFKCLPNLQVLNLESINVGRIQNNVFSSLHKLTELHMTRIGNPLKHIDDFAFNSSSLEVLVLIQAKFPFNNKGRFNADTLFAYCPNLKRLDLSGNRMPLDENTFIKMIEPLSKLQSLLLITSGLTFLPKNIFKNMPSLRKINLEDNSINSWNGSNEIFGNMTSLADLNLSHNDISVINETSFPSVLLSSIKRIFLSRNPFLCTCEQMWFRNWIEKNQRILQAYPEDYRCRYPNQMNGILLANYKPTEKICNPWNPLYTMAIILGFVVLMAVAAGVAIVKCQANIKNYVYLLRVYRYKQKGYVSLTNEDDFEFHAFVVYCDQDRTWVHEEFLRKIEHEEGLKLCIHHRNFIPGETITSNVDKFMQKSWKVVVVMSNNFTESEWCQWEVDVVHERRRQRGPASVVPIMLQNIDSKHMTSRIKTLLESTPYLRYRSGVGSDLFWKTVIESLRKPLGHPPVSLT